MGTEFELSYTATEIDEKLGQIDSFSQKITELESSLNDYINKTQYSITYNLIDVISSNMSSEKFKGDTYFTILSAVDTGNEIETINVTMNGNDITSQVYTNGIIVIEEVIGDIIVTASTTWNYEVKDFMISQKQKIIWNDETEELEVEESENHAVIYSTILNDGSFLYGENTLYLIPVPLKAKNITIGNNSDYEFSCRYQGFTKNSEDNKFTRIFDSEPGKPLTYDFVGGQTDYIAITLLMSGVESWPDDFDSSLINITFNDLM